MSLERLHLDIDRLEQQDRKKKISKAGRNEAMQRQHQKFKVKINEFLTELKRRKEFSKNSITTEIAIDHPRYPYRMLPDNLFFILAYYKPDRMVVTIEETKSNRDLSISIQKNNTSGYILKVKHNFLPLSNTQVLFRSTRDATNEVLYYEKQFNSEFGLKIRQPVLSIEEEKKHLDCAKQILDWVIGETDREVLRKLEPKR